jgi:large subunit ribosomal protein L23
MSFRLNIIRRRLLTEKNAESAEDQKKVYVFEVDIKANKIQIRKALEEAFQLKGKIDKVRTAIRPGKKKRRGRHRAGYGPDRKKAILTLKRNVEIPDF